jgi:hypothetical protein
MTDEIIDPTASTEEHSTELVTSETDDNLEYNETLQALQGLLSAAHDSLEGKGISEIPLNHPYWGLMESARRFKHDKGL